MAEEHPQPKLRLRKPAPAPEASPAAAPAPAATPAAGAPGVPDRARSSPLPLLAALGCVGAAFLVYTQVLRPRRDAPEPPPAARPANAPPPDAAKSGPERRAPTEAGSRAGTAVPERAVPPAPAGKASRPAEVRLLGDLDYASPEAGAEFRGWVANARITGVLEAPPARVMIEDRLYREGEIVEPRLGIRFEGVQPSTRRLIFRNAQGAMVARRY